MHLDVPHPSHSPSIYTRAHGTQAPSLCVPKIPSLLIFGKDGFCHELAFPISVLLRRTPSALMPMAASLNFRGRMTSLPMSDRPPGFSARGGRADASHRPLARGYALRLPERREQNQIERLFRQGQTQGLGFRAVFRSSHCVSSLPLRGVVARVALM